MSCAIDSLIEHGACSEELWVNDINLIYEKLDSAADESLLIYEFSIHTFDPEAWVEALDAPCQGFDYSYDVAEDSGNGEIYILEISNFDVKAEDPDTFLDDLETLCGD